MVLTPEYECLALQIVIENNRLVEVETKLSTEEEVGRKECADAVSGYDYENLAVKLQVPRDCGCAPLCIVQETHMN